MQHHTHTQEVGAPVAAGGGGRVCIETKCSTCQVRMCVDTSLPRPLLVETFRGYRETERNLILLMTCALFLPIKTLGGSDRLGRVGWAHVCDAANGKHPVCRALDPTRPRPKSTDCAQGPIASMLLCSLHLGISLCRSKPSSTSRLTPSSRRRHPRSWQRQGQLIRVNYVKLAREYLLWPRRH